MNGKQVLNSKCEFTFNEQGYIDKLHIYETNGTRATTVFTLTYYDSGELKSIDSAFEEKVAIGIKSITTRNILGKTTM